MRILNCTPHAITIMAGTVYNPTTRNHFVGKQTKIVKEIPSSGNTLNAYYERYMDDLNGLPIDRITYTNVDPIPENVDYVIVSAIYVEACKKLGKDTTKCLTVGKGVFSNEGKIRKPVGTTSLKCN